MDGWKRGCSKGKKGLVGREGLKCGKSEHRTYRVVGQTQERAIQQSQRRTLICSFAQTSEKTCDRLLQGNGRGPKKRERSFLVGVNN